MMPWILWTKGRVMILKCKKIILAVLLLNTSSVWADISNMQAEQDFDGFYVGGAVGLSNLTDKLEYVVNSGTEHLGNMGFVGGLYIGFDYNFSLNDLFFTETQVYNDPKMGKMGPVASPNDFKIGIEGFGNANGGLGSTINHTSLPVIVCLPNGDLSTATISYDAPSSTSIESGSPYNAGLRILPAYQFQPGLFGHLILGWAYSNFTINDNGRNGFVNSSFGRNGIQGGLGWQTAISTPFSWRLDMMYTYYGTQETAGRGLASSGSASQTYRQTLATLETFISLVYKF
jgi:hypothetical protein